jgi:hypothetical protein
MGCSHSLISHSSAVATSFFLPRLAAMIPCVMQTTQARRSTVNLDQSKGEATPQLTLPTAREEEEDATRARLRRDINAKFSVERRDVCLHAIPSCFPPHFGFPHGIANRRLLMCSHLTWVLTYS